MGLPMIWSWSYSASNKQFSRAEQNKLHDKMNSNQTFYHRFTAFRWTR